MTLADSFCQCCSLIACLHQYCMGHIQGAPYLLRFGVTALQGHLQR